MTDEKKEIDRVWANHEEDKRKRSPVEQWVSTGFYYVQLYRCGEWTDAVKYAAIGEAKKMVDSGSLKGKTRIIRRVETLMEC